MIALVGAWLLAADQASAAESWRAEREIAIYTAPAEPRQRRGVVPPGASFEVAEHQVAEGCRDWGLVALGGWACLDRATLSTEAPASLAVESPEAMPYLYGKARGVGPVSLYPSAAAFARGKAGGELLDPERSYAFAGREPTARGEVLRLRDGRVVPSNRVRLYQASDFHGIDDAALALLGYASPAWCVATSGCALGDGTRLDYHALFDASVSEPRSEAGVARWRPAARPAGVGESDLWVDIDVGEQVLALVRGDHVEYLTLAATGRRGRWETPVGEHLVLDKLLANDMLSRADSPEPYAVEGVPWVVHFAHRYAIHGAYWHDRFGRRTSHGCVNLSPVDARALFAALSPPLPPGWRAVYADPTDLPTLVRVR